MLHQLVNTGRVWVAEGLYVGSSRGPNKNKFRASRFWGVQSNFLGFHRSMSMLGIMLETPKSVRHYTVGCCRSLPNHHACIVA